MINPTEEMPDITSATIDFEQLEVVAAWVTTIGDVIGAIATTGLYIQSQQVKAKSAVDAMKKAANSTQGKKKG